MRSVRMDTASYRQATAPECECITALARRCEAVSLSSRVDLSKYPCMCVVRASAYEFAVVPQEFARAWGRVATSV